MAGNFVNFRAVFLELLKIQIYMYAVEYIQAVLLQVEWKLNQALIFYFKKMTSKETLKKWRHNWHWVDY